MRATKNERINAMAQDWIEIFVQDSVGNTVPRPTFLDEGHKQRTGACEDLGRIAPRKDTVAVGFASDRCARADNADAVIARTLQRSTHAEHVLHATTIALTFCCSRNCVSSHAKRTTVLGDLVP